MYFQTDVELFYKFSPLLIQYTPVDTVSAWIKQGRKLEAKRLIPALVQYEHEKYREQVIKYWISRESGIKYINVNDRLHMKWGLKP